MYCKILISAILFSFAQCNVLNYGATKCPKGWFQYESSCYFKQNELLNFDEAARLCKQKNAKLFYSDDSFEWDAIRTLFPDFYFTWVQAELEEELEWLFEPYEETINGKTSVAKCIACYSSPTKHYNYYYSCSSRFHSICEKPLNTFRQWVS